MRAWWREIRALVARLRAVQRLGRQLERGEVTAAEALKRLDELEVGPR